LTPSSTIVSVDPGSLDATHGSPVDIASSNAIGNPSRADGSEKKSAARKYS